MLRFLVVITTFLVLANGLFSRFPAPRLDGRIVGGSPVEIKDYPYQLSLLNYNRHNCGASIISKNWVLTAAHCVEGASASSITFRAGSSVKNQGGTIYQAKGIYAHPKFDYWNIDYDYALVEIEDEFPLGQEGVNSVELADKEPQEGDVAEVTGWGTLSSGGASPSQLQRVGVHIIGRRECQEKYEGNSITERMICAGEPEGGKDSCQGDSGGPLVVNGKLSGIVSWGRGCASAYYPGVYTNVVVQLDWIKKVSGV